ncbi:hypothetical protein ACFVFQ_01815 [Streptomyces sp. NPDC057743]|uniref:hypothetical protein n=1 Tax=Streptomyces sp. NPDC057743 TaxID=3346236 RepID=UPI0036CCDE02
MIENEPDGEPGGGADGEPGGDPGGGTEGPSSPVTEIGGSGDPSAQVTGGDDELLESPQPSVTTEAEPAASGGIPFVISPDAFNFAPDPGGANWQSTGCVTIQFAYGSPFLTPIKFKVGVIVGAPITLRDGRILSVREAQLDSANAAQAAATIIKEMLDSGTIDPSSVQPRFVGFMGGAILSTGLGYRVNGCRPS